MHYHIKLATIGWLLLAISPSFAKTNSDAKKRLCKELKTLSKESDDLEKELNKTPHGLFKKERKALLDTNLQIKKLSISIRKRLLTFDIISLDISGAIIELINATTFLVYALAISIILIAVVYSTKML